MTEFISRKTTLKAVVIAKETCQGKSKKENEAKNCKKFDSFATVDYPISYDEFFNNFLLENKPCLLKKWATENWNSVHEWAIKKHSQNFVPNFQVLEEKFGKSQVPVANCRQRSYNAQEKKEMTFMSYLDYWKKYIKDGYPESDNCLYLKDWHFVREFPNYEAYKTPEYFSSDWLNEIWDKKLKPACDDFRFVYMGPKGSWTPFHADVYRSYSWSANICGRKKWYFYPPGYEDLLRDQNNHLPYDVESFLITEDNHPLEVIQEQGEIIFVPSGWHHQVHNLEDTISINHNWLNSCNIHNCWTFLQKELLEVEKEISDCRKEMTKQEWNDQCQMILEVNSGMNYASFLQFISNIAKERLKIIQPKPIHNLSYTTDLNVVLNDINTVFNLLTTGLSKSTEFVSSKNHAMIDLVTLLPVLIEMVQRYTVVYPNNLAKSDPIFKVICKINFSIKHYVENIT